MTEIHPDVGLIWGFGTGERGVKYVIAPRLKIGGIYQKEIFKKGGTVSSRPCETPATRMNPRFFTGGRYTKSLRKRSWRY